MRYRKNYLVGANPPCQHCDGRCCRQKPHDQEYAVLLNNREVKYFSYAVLHDSSFGYHEWVIPYKKGKCPYLGKDNRCTIYENRPKACKQFKCTNCYNREGKHSFFLQDNPKVVKLIQLHVLGESHD